MLIQLAANFRAKIYWASRMLNVVGAVVVMLLMLFIVVDVILRNVLNKPVQGSFEIVEFMMAVLVFSFFANGQRVKGHISVDMFVRLLPEKVRRFIDVFNYFIATGFFALVTIQMLRQTYEIFVRNDMSPSIQIPQYPFLLLASIGALCLTLALLVDFFSALFNVKPIENP